MPGKSKYTHIFFDLDNTLWDFEKNSYLAMNEAFKHFIKEPEVIFDVFFTVYTKYNDFLWNEYRNQQIVKKELILKRFRLTFDDLNINNVDPEQMNEFYLSEMPKQKFLNEGAFELLEYLKKKNYQLSIITNGFREVQFKKLGSSGLSGYFAKVFISEIVKTPKPGREIFEYAIKSTNAKKSKSLMVGDDWEVDILGAFNYGIDSIYYNRENSYTESKKMLKRSRENKIYLVNTLDEIKTIL